MNLPVSIRLAASLPALFCLPADAALTADDAPRDSPILANLSLEELSQIKIVSVSQRVQPLANAAAAVHVVTSEDIARSGATSIPEALRNVPGLNVAQINGSAWAIGARGFQSQFSNKLLVMVDGVSVYSPVFSGVFWDQQNYFLPDLEQIEVVLGPGGSIWGANAVNGVVNVVTKSARDTQGGMVYAGGGNEKAVMAGARYGWLADTNVYARVYGIYNYDNPTVRIGGGDAPDATSSGQGGFRLDGYPRGNSEWTVKGDVRWAANDDLLLQPDLTRPPSYVFTNTAMTRSLGGQLLGHWQTEMNPDSTLQIQGYYDFSKRNEVAGSAAVQTADMQLHHTWSGWRRQVIDWGVDGRMVYRDSEPGWATYDPMQATEWLGSGFVQDEISLVPDALKLTGGIKLEEHSDVGFMPQPNARLTWQPAERHTFWVAWSRALRSPQATELNSQIDVSVLRPMPPNPFPTVVRLAGNASLEAEKLQAWEIGWRWQARQSLTLDVAGYYYHYDDLISTTSAGKPGYDPALKAVVVPLTYVNGAEGDAYGGEMALTWRPVDRWLVSASYSVRHTMLHSYVQPDQGYAGHALDAPRQTVALNSSLKLGRAVELSGALRYLDNIPYSHTPAYVELDAQLAWRPNERWQFSLVGQNLLHDQHLEYTSSLAGQTAEIPRGVYAKVTYKF